MYVTDCSQVFIAAIDGLVPPQMVQCLSMFMDFCYIVRRNAITTSDIIKLQGLLDQFHELRNIFIDTGTRVDISLPRQHSLVHYIRGITLFGSPNGICSSITESKHIKAIKEPWRRSSRNKPLPQILQTISRDGKMDAISRIYESRGMLTGTTSSYIAQCLEGNVPIGEAAAFYDLNDDDSDNEEVDDVGPTSAPRPLDALSSVKLAARRRRLSFLVVYCPT